MKRFLLLAVLALLGPSTALAASFSLGGPQSTTVGGTFSVPVLLTTAPGESANAVTATITFSNQLTLLTVSKGGSIVSLWPADPTQTSASMHFEGIILNPGYSGAGGTVVTLTFQANSAGSAALAFEDASILANDGNATPILTAASPKTITILPAGVTTPATTIAIDSPTHPDQNATYSNPDVSLNWTLDTGATAVRIGYDKDPTGQPTVVYDANTTHKDITLKDGTWYFHVQDKINGVWSSITTYRIKIKSSASAPAVQEPVVPPSIPEPSVEPVQPVPVPGIVTVQAEPLFGIGYAMTALIVVLLLLLSILLTRMLIYLFGYEIVIRRRRRSNIE